MDPREVGGVHLAIPKAIIGRGAKTSEEVQLAIDQPHMNNRHNMNVLLGGVSSLPERNRTAIPRVPESGGVSVSELELFYINS